MRKQASSRVIKKHLRNGGMNSFNFHPSPRMIPHIFKPEVQFVELSIEQYVSRGKKVKDDHAIETPAFKEKLTAAETDLIAKYFNPTNDSTWRPSLIAFPHFQALPSRVHKVMHSCRTGMLIDMMQYLQGLTFSGNNTSFLVENEVSADKHLRVQTVEQCENDEKDAHILDHFQGTKSLREVRDSELSPVRTLRTEEKQGMPDYCRKSLAAHSYLFGSDFVSVDALGNVLVISLPALPLKELSDSEKTRATDTLLLNSWKHDSIHLKTSDKNYDELTVQAKAVEEQTTSQIPCIKDGALPMSRLCKSDALPEKPLDGFDKILKSPVLKRNHIQEGDTTRKTLDVIEIKEPLPLVDEDDDYLRDSELSPRLTNLIKSDALPEKSLDGFDKILKSPVLNRNHIQEGDTTCKTLDIVVIKEPLPLVDEDDDYLRDSELSPRLTNLIKTDALPEKPLDGFDKILKSPVLKRNDIQEGDTTCKTLDVVEIKEPLPVVDEDDDYLRDSELSPRLTNLIKSGVVPESPMNERGLSNETRNAFIPDFASPDKSCFAQPSKSSSLGNNEKGCSTDDRDGGQNVSVSPVNKKIQTPLLKMNNIARAGGYAPSSPMAEETKTPLAKLTNNSSGRDWQLSSGDKSENFKPTRKFKRLCKVADRGKNRNQENMKENVVVPVVNLAQHFSCSSPNKNKHSRGKKKPMDNVRTFIEEEAEVSSEAESSDDEEDDQDNNSYDDSFIDDRIKPSTEAESGVVDMIAIYRRSLLSQSPVVRQSNFSAIYSPDSVTPMARISESGSSSGKTLNSLQTPQTESVNQSACRNSECIQIDRQRTASEAMNCASTDLLTENERNLENRKRKLSYYQSGSIPAINLEQRFSFQSEDTGKESRQLDQADNIDAHGETIDDDQFYENLDLDAVEEHAALLLKQKSEFPNHKQELIPQPERQNLGVHGFPSFDLGI